MDHGKFEDKFCPLLGKVSCHEEVLLTGIMVGACLSWAGDRAEWVLTAGERKGGALG